MSLLSTILPAAPPKQDVTSTIQTLCLRLSTGTLLEDRRAAIQGLRSFTKTHKELVASEGLRPLITTLKKDREDVETLNYALETLLGLWKHDENNVEGSEDIALWLTDEFTQKQENINLLVELLEDVDFYVRRYTIEILTAMTANRPARTQQCLLEAPMGMAQLVAALKDQRDAIRDEAILLIIHVAEGHTDNQKALAALEIFETVFDIIDLEGGVDGGLVVQDCLQLLSNLLSSNFSNQSYIKNFIGFAPLAKLFTQPEPEGLRIDQKQQRNTNLLFSLRVVRHFVVPGGLGTVENQAALAMLRYEDMDGEKVPVMGGDSVLFRVIMAAFLPKCDFMVKAECLRAAADIIDGNDPLQRSIAAIWVPTEDGAEGRVHVIDALLNLAMVDQGDQAVDTRLAACRCLEAYISGNQPVREHFLRHAINLHSEGDESPNIITCILHLDSESRGDPYRVWIANVILIHLIYADTKVKELAASIREGDAEAGEEEITAIQTIGANLSVALEHHYDPRIAIGYLMLLCVWFFEDSDAVDDFLNEAGFLHSLINGVKDNNVDPIAQGLAACLLGIIYEFSHNESPLPRKTIHPLLSSQLGRDLYVSKITKLRSHPMIRDFEVLKDQNVPEFHLKKHGLPEVYFDRTFIDFFKDSYSQILKAMDKDPGLETRVDSSGVTRISNGVSLALMDSLQAQLATLNTSLSTSESTRLQLEQQLASLQHDLTRSRETLKSTQSTHENKLRELATQNSSNIAETERKYKSLLEDMRIRNQTAREELNRKVEEKSGEINALQKRIEEAMRTVKSADNDRNNVRQQLEAKERELMNTRKEAEETIKKWKGTVQERDQHLVNLQRQFEEARRVHAELEKAAGVELKELEKRLKETAQWEIDALKTDVESLKGQLANQGKQHAEVLERLKKEYDQKLAQAKAEAAKEAEALKKRAEEAEKAAMAAEDTAIEANRGLEEKIAVLEAALEAASQDEKLKLQAAETAQGELSEKLAAAEKARDEALEKQKAAEAATAEAEKRSKEASESSAQNSGAHENELKSLRDQLATAEKAHKDAEEKLAASVSSVQADTTTLDELKEKLKVAEEAQKAAEEEREKLKKEALETAEKTKKAEQAANEAEESLKAKEAEMEDLFMILADLEEKRKNDKKRLKDLDQEVSEDEDDEDEDGDDEDE